MIKNIKKGFLVISDALFVHHGTTSKFLPNGTMKTTLAMDKSMILIKISRLKETKSIPLTNVCSLAKRITKKRREPSITALRHHKVIK